MAPSCLLPQLNFENKYGTPDRPYSLFEGLAGAVCAWLDACVIVKAQLSQHQNSGDDGASGISESEVNIHKQLLGIPGLGGLGCHGLF